MRYVLLALFAVLLATSAHAQPYQPSYPPLNPENGIAAIGWENGVGADLAVAHLDRGDCPIASQGPPEDTGDPAQAVTRVPDARHQTAPCLLRPGDHVYLWRYKGGDYLDRIGPWNVPIHVRLPMVAR